MAILKVLVVEDHEDWQEILAAYVDQAMQNSSNVCHTRVVNTFTNAWTMLNEEGPWDLLVTDIGLGAVRPGQNLGKRLVERARYLHVPSIVVSGTPGLTKQEVRDILLEYQAADFFDKFAFDGEKFSQKVRTILHSPKTLTDASDTSESAPARDRPTTTPQLSAPLEIFFSYAHEDEALRDKLIKQLRLLERQRIITGWSDRCITAGTEWMGQISSHLQSAGIILLLISSDFIASDYCYDLELSQAMERHNAGKARVIPVILRPADWQTAPFGKLQALPKNGKPITTWANEDEAFLDVAQGIRRAVQEITFVP